MKRPLVSIVAGALITVVMSAPALAQGKSQQDHSKTGGNNSPGGNNGKGGGAGAASPPSQVVLAAPTSAAPATPFAWIDNAYLMAPGAVWIGISAVRWQSAGLSEVSFPVVDAAVGVTPRIQLGASVPRVLGSTDFEGQQGGVGTTFVNAKIGILNDSEQPLKLAVTPTLEILSQSAMQWVPLDQNRVQWGLPVSVEFDRNISRIYGSTGYFSPGMWYVGGGIGTQVHSRVGASVSFSRAWGTTALSDPSIPAATRNDLSAGVSVDLTPNVGVFGSVGRTFKTAAQYGAGTTFSVGLSLTADGITFKN